MVERVRKRTRFSLKTKTAVMIILIALAISLAAFFLSSWIVKEIIMTQYSKQAKETTKAVAASLDADDAAAVRDAISKIFDSTEDKVRNDDRKNPKFEEYLSKYSEIENLPEYGRILDDLTKIQNSIEVDCLYLAYLDANERCYVYMVDATPKDDPEYCPPGSFDPIYLDEAATDALLANPAEGIPDNVTHTDEYGWLFAVSTPIFDDDGNVVAYAAADYLMADIMAQRNKFLVAAGIVLFLMTVVLSAIATAIVHKVIVKPINVLSETAEKEQADESATVEYGFENVRIRTGDEIETLAVSMAKMEKVINEHIENLIRTRNELDESRRQIEAATEMANVDSMTGVRNKRAYDSATAELDGEIAEGTAKFGIAMFDLNGLKTINDEYGHDKGDVAIRTLCDLVCGRLKRSPVFRIGGDEFVAILKGDDFERADELLGSIERTIDARNADDRLEPWEKGSAAVGYAEFDRNVDSSVEDVFKRADATMYETKAAMKGENPKR